MDMIGHHAPSQQIVPPSVVKAQCCIHKRADFGSAQVTLPNSLIEVSFKLLAPFAVIFNFQQGSPFRTQRPREGVGEVKSDELRESWFIAMRQVTALVPAAKAVDRILAFRT